MPGVRIPAVALQLPGEDGMSNRRKLPPSHPGQDEISVVYPGPEILPPPGVDGDEWQRDHADEITRIDTVSRDEFLRRMAGVGSIVQQVNANRRIRVVTLLDPKAVVRWWKTA